MISARTVLALFCSSLALGACISKPPSNAAAGSASALIGSTIGLDHVLLWSKDPVAAERVLTHQMGFTIGAAGSYGAGLANKLVRFENRSFIEFLWMTDPNAAKASAPWAYDFVTQHNGSNSFGVQVSSIDEAYSALRTGGLKPDEPMSEAWDPDGPNGPKPPIVNKWRYMFLEAGELPGDPFFVEYQGGKPKDAPTVSPHANGARVLSAVWVAVEDLDSGRRAYERAGFSGGVSIDLPDLHGKGISLRAGDGNIVLMAPTGDGPLKERLKVRGPHVAGISVQVADLEATARVIEKDSGRQSLVSRACLAGQFDHRPRLRPWAYGSNFTNRTWAPWSW